MSSLVLKRVSDEHLGGRLAKGEAAAFDEFYRRYVHRLAAYGAYVLGDPAGGDDVAQSALLKAYTALRSGPVPERLRPWLYRIAHNVALDAIRRRRELAVADVPEAPVPEAPELGGALAEAVAALPDRQRRVYVLRELRGLRMSEVAETLGLTGPQIEQALFAARNRLAEHLVFGERLSCTGVRKLVLGPLDGEERRALRTHLHSCAECRAAASAAGAGSLRAPLLVPFEWLRGLGGLLVGGGAPVAAKVAVVAATATIATGVSVHEVAWGPHAHQPEPLQLRAPGSGSATRAVPSASAPAPAPAPAPQRRTASAVEPARLVSAVVAPAVRAAPVVVHALRHESDGAQGANATASEHQQASQNGDSSSSSGNGSHADHGSPSGDETSRSSGGHGVSGSGDSGDGTHHGGDGAGGPQTVPSAPTPAPAPAPTPQPDPTPPPTESLPPIAASPSLPGDSGDELSGGSGSGSPSQSPSSNDQSAGGGGTPSSSQGGDNTPSQPAGGGSSGD